MSTMIAPRGAAPAPAPAPAAPAPQPRTCSVCWATGVLSSTAVPVHEDDKDNSSLCINSACAQCWTRHAESHLKDGKAATCMRCSKALALPFLSSLSVSAKLRERADAMLLRRCLLMTPFIYHCPRAGCPCSFIVEPDRRASAWQVVRSTALPAPAPAACFSVKCPACTQEICTGCKAAMHTTPCTKRADEDGVGRWRQVHTKPCPGCKLPVEKNGGCHHMSCSVCLLQFCWECLVPIENHVCPVADAPLVRAAPTLRRVPRVSSDRPPRRADPARRHPRAAPPPAAAAAPVVEKKKEKKKKAEAEPPALVFDPRSLRRSILV